MRGRAIGWQWARARADVPDVPDASGLLPTHSDRKEDAATDAQWMIKAKRCTIRYLMAYPDSCRIRRMGRVIQQDRSRARYDVRLKGVGGGRWDSGIAFVRHTSAIFVP